MTHAVGNRTPVKSLANLLPTNASATRRNVALWGWGLFRLGRDLNRSVPVGRGGWGSEVGSANGILAWTGSFGSAQVVKMFGGARPCPGRRAGNHELDGQVPSSIVPGISVLGNPSNWSIPSLGSADKRSGSVLVVWGLGP